MRRFLLVLIILAIFLLLMVAMIAPLFIQPTPASGVSDGEQVAEANSQFISLPFSGTQGLSIHYRQATSPHPDAAHQFVLLHGFTFNLFTWDAVFDFFAQHGQVVSYDQVPYGLSEKLLPGSWEDINPYAKTAALDQLWTLLDHLDLEQVILVGNSSGGTLALEAALARPERVQALVLIAPWVYSKRPTLPQIVVNSPQMMRLLLLAARMLGTNTPLLERSYADPEQISAERRQLALTHTRLAGWDLAWAELLKQSLRERLDLAAQLTAIQQPALIILGNQDRLISLTETAQLASALPNAELAVLPDCGHVPQEECPALVQALIASWLRQLEQ